MKKWRRKREPLDHQALATRRLRVELARILPENAIDRYSDLVGGLFGDNLDQVIGFALISFLHDRVVSLEWFRKRRIEAAAPQDRARVFPTEQARARRPPYVGAKVRSEIERRRRAEMRQDRAESDK